MLILIIAIAAGFFTENYESKNPCPSYCEIDHEHVVYDTKQGQANKRDIAETEE